jgi:hypothetical protein
VASDKSQLKLQHQRGFQAGNALEAALVLDFAAFATALDKSITI